MDVKKAHELALLGILGIVGFLVGNVLLALVTDVAFAFLLLLGPDLVFELYEVFFTFLVILFDVLRDGLDSYGSREEEGTFISLSRTYSDCFISWFCLWYSFLHSFKVFLHF